jgi:hypothetical protein
LRFLKNGVEVGSCPVIQHQKKETMAAILLAWSGKYTLFVSKWSLAWNNSA